MEREAPPSDVDLSPTRNCHCLAARREARELTRRYEERLRPHGIRATQFSVLAALAQMGPTPITELARVLGLERTTLTRSADLMENDGWIEDAPAEDGRKRPLQLTDEGRRKVEAAFPAWREVQRQVSRERERGGPPGATWSAGGGR
jgi:DNA-binding MarR family transcriptional regulator